MADLSIETAVIEQTGRTYLAGIDEAGRGALAGPVVAAAVILPLSDPAALAQLTAVNDSKQLTAKKRDQFYELISQYALAFAVGAETAATIDQIGIIAATKRAMSTAVAQLNIPADYLLIDGTFGLPHINLPQQAIVRGDGRSLSIAAASIVAKVTRDRLLQALALDYPLYGFATHKGYGTLRHRRAIEEHGPCPDHRHSFAPIKRPLL